MAKELNFNEKEMNNLYPSIRKEVIDYMNSNNGDTDQPRSFNDGLTYYDYASISLNEWVKKRCGNWNPLENLHSYYNRIDEFCDDNETLNNLTSIITNKTLDEYVIVDLFNYVFIGYEIQDMFVGYNHLYEYVESYLDKDTECMFEINKFFPIVDIINENGGLETFNSLKSVDEIVIDGEKRDMEVV